jgi:DNA-binding NarL/FixJ family response regulator
MTETFQIVIVDDHPLFRQGVVGTLCAEADIEVVGEGDTAEDAMRLGAELLPDILLLDISIPGGGLNVIPKIAAACPVTKIVMLTASEEEDDVIAALKAGARGYIVKGVSARELVRILRSIQAGEAYVTPALAASLLSVMSGKLPGTREENPIQDLSERERQILELVAGGRSNKEIGQQLFLSEKTVKHYMTNILQKLHVRNRVEAALLAHKVQASDHRPDKGNS